MLGRILALHEQWDRSHCAGIDKLSIEVENFMSECSNRLPFGYKTLFSWIPNLIEESGIFLPLSIASRVNGHILCHNRTKEPEKTFIQGRSQEYDNLQTLEHKS